MEPGRWCAALSLSIAAPFCFAQTAARDAPVPWACGGVSSDERSALPTQVPDANLQLLFVAGKRGAYTAGTEWRVLDRSNEPIAFGVANGPQCFLRLPPGPVRVEARLKGDTRTASTTIRADARGARLVFTFASDVVEEIEPSEEEKAQARTP
jgi:hypothetical protein